MLGKLRSVVGGPIRRWKDRQRASVVWARGLKEYHSRNYDTAVKEFEEAARLSPAAYAIDAIHFSFLGQAYCQINQPKEAVVALERAAALLRDCQSRWDDSIRKRYIVTLKVLANSYHATGDDERAKEVAQQVEEAESSAEATA